MLLFNYPANSTKLGNAVKYILDFFFPNTEWIICKTDSQTKSIRLCFGNEASPSNGLSPARSIGTHYHSRQTCCSWKYWVRLIHKNKNWQSTSASLISCYAPALLIALLKQYELKKTDEKNNLIKSELFLHSFHWVISWENSCFKTIKISELYSGIVPNFGTFECFFFTTMNVFYLRNVDFDILSMT